MTLKGGFLGSALFFALGLSELEDFLVVVEVELPAFLVVLGMIVERLWGGEVWGKRGREKPEKRDF